MATNTRFIEWVDPKAEVIQVASFLSRWRAARSAEFAFHGHEIDDRPASSQLNQVDLVLAALDRASENFAVEAKHAVEVDHAQHKMVDFTNVDHRWCDVGA